MICPSIRSLEIEWKEMYIFTVLGFYSVTKVVTTIAWIGGSMMWKGDESKHRALKVRTERV